MFNNVVNQIASGFTAVANIFISFFNAIVSIFWNGTDFTFWGVFFLITFIVSILIWGIYVIMDLIGVYDRSWMPVEGGPEDD